MKNENRGITLIALVVTIIVLIILAGVGISLILGENGIITKTKYSKQVTLNAEVAEQEQLNEAASYLESMREEEVKPPVQDDNNENTKPEIEYSYDNPYIPTGFKHTGEGTWNSGYVIRQTSTGDEFVWVPCVLDQAKVKEGDTVETFEKNNIYNTWGGELLPEDTYVMEEDSSVSEIEESVGKYGGFYIARYEAGIEGETANYYLDTKTATDGSVKPLSQAGKGVWNWISREDAITVAKAMINEESTGARSTLISGAAWDTTLQWMVNASDNKDENMGYDSDSTGKGWYNDVSDLSPHTTGYYAVNNIYDMAGNVGEYTTENCRQEGEHFIVYRGGHFSYDITPSEYPASYRNSDQDMEADIIGLRVVLYK